MAFKNKAAQALKQLIKRKPWYWIKVAIIIIAGIWGGHWLNEGEYLIGPRYRTYRFLQRLTPFPPYPKHTALVLIQDEEYWRGCSGDKASGSNDQMPILEGRVPIKRDYIGKLIEALDKANVRAIAIDFDLRSQSQEGCPDKEPLTYQKETEYFCAAVKKSSRRIILPRTIGLTWLDNGDYVYEAKQDIYDSCDIEGGRIGMGYIALPPDIRQVPLLSLPIKNGVPLDSFSQAIARSCDEDTLKRLVEKEELPYGNFIEQKEFANKVVSAGDILRGDPQALSKVENRIVIVSGAWHTQGYETGSQIDSYDTPVGTIPGAYIHANYVEAMLDSRLYRTWGGWTLVAIEILLSLCVAIPFALEIRATLKFLAVFLIGFIVLVFSYFSLLNLGLFFDPFIPLILVAAHGVVEQIREWRAAAHNYWRVSDLIPENTASGGKA